MCLVALVVPPSWVLVVFLCCHWVLFWAPWLCALLSLVPFGSAFLGSLPFRFVASWPPVFFVLVIWGPAVVPSVLLLSLFSFASVRPCACSCLSVGGPLLVQGPLLVWPWALNGGFFASWCAGVLCAPPGVFFIMAGPLQCAGPLGVLDWVTGWPCWFCGFGGRSAPLCLGFLPPGCWGLT